MKKDENIKKEFEAILHKFSSFIKAHIYKYNLQKYGIDNDDILQDINIKIWKVSQSEKKIEKGTSYIKKIINSSVIDHLRKLKREKRILLYEKQNQISEKCCTYETEIINEKNAKEIVANAVDMLIESRRKVVKLFLLGMTIGEIATCFSWSKDKTRNLLYRGLSDLKKVLKEKGIEYESE